MISEEYRKLNTELHERDIGYGTSGHIWAPQIKQLKEVFNCETVLDYGCGQRTLYKAFDEPHWMANYDPAIEEFSDPPEPADLVVCGDVMEHVEEEYVRDVLKDIYRLTEKVAFFIISTVPAKKILADGRNAHITIWKSSSWVTALMVAGFEPVQFADFGGGEILFVGKKEI